MALDRRHFIAGMADAACTRFPSAYASNGEFLAIKRALQGFQGGELVMNLPPPQRRPPSPYERACLIAWADMDEVTMQIKGDERSYVIGDAIGAVSPLLFRYYPKSAHVANRLGRVVAYQISEQLAGRTPEKRLPDKLCYMVVNGSPGQALNVQFDYGFDDQGRVRQVQRDFNERTPALFKDDFRWADFMFAEMFGGMAPPVLPLPAYRA